MDSYATAAKSWANGLTGGKSGTNSETNAAEGGFGGGAVSHGGTYIRSGGGGGYSGGGGSGYDSGKSAGAGGSYYNTTYVSGFTVGDQYSGHGKVIVTFEPSYTP